jgi:hypothetical protein
VENKTKTVNAEFFNHKILVNFDEARTLSFDCKPIKMEIKMIET